MSANSLRVPSHLGESTPSASASGAKVASGSAGKGAPSDHDARVIQSDLTALLEALARFSASDLHLKPGRPPLYRVSGKLVVAKAQKLSQEQVRSYLFSLLTHEQRAHLEEKRSLDFSFFLGEKSRYRCNVYYQRGELAGVIRAIHDQIPSIESLGLPNVFKTLAQKNQGLLIIGGPTGSGKTTSLASAIQFLNENFPYHILTLEDPIEYVFRDAQSTVSQREVGHDVPSFEAGLVAALRQDPDVVVLGELRERRTIEVALSAAETGHLVITTLHTSDAKTALERMIDVFPSDAQSQVRIQLASSLIGVVSQKLLPSIEPQKRVLAAEVLVKSPHIEQLIQRNEINKIPEVIADSSSYYHMQSFNQAIEHLLRAGQITQEVALEASPHPEDLRLSLQGMTRDRKR